MTEVIAKAQMLIHRPASEVFEAFADPAIMTQFWFPKASGRLEEGKEVSWYVVSQGEEYEITVHVKAAEKPRFLHIEWGAAGQFTDVEWRFEAQGDKATILRIKESGFSGDQSDIMRAALNSTGGFNQVITAMKALLEHGVRINVVEDHVI